MSQYVARSSLCGTVITAHSRLRTIGTLANRMPLVVSVVSPFFSFPPHYGLTRVNSSYFIDTPEASGSSLISPSSIFGVSSSVLVSPTTSSSADSSGGSSSNAGTIAGGIIGVIVALIIIPAAIILYLRRRLKARAAMPADVIASHPQPPQSDEVAPSLSGSPITMKFYVCDLESCVELVCPHVLLSFAVQGPK